MGGSVSALKDLDTVTKRLQYLSEFYPNRELYVFYSSGVRDVYTSRRLYTLAGRFANRLRQYGFQKGDVIANTLNNSPERVVTDLGLMLAGCVTMNVQLLLADGSDFLLSAKNSKCQAVILSSEKKGPARKLISRFFSGEANNGCTPVAVPDAPHLKSAILIDRDEKCNRRDFLNDLEMPTDEIFVCPVESDDLLAVLTTSGSNGYSKLVPKTHAENLLYERSLSIIGLHDVNFQNSQEKPFKLYNDTSLGWIAGMTHGPICHGDSRVLLDIFGAEFTRSGKEIFEVLTKEEISVAQLMCVEMELLRDHIDSIGGSDYRLNKVLTGGQPIRKKQLEEFLKLSEELVVMYGSTEAGHLTTLSLHKGDVLESNNNGLPVQDVLLRIVSDEGKPCQPYENGTIEVKGPCVLSGYFNRLVTPDPQTPKAFTSDGWFKMDDYGHMDKNGNVFVYGRTKDIIVYGGNLFYPGWMEKKLMEHPDIMEAIVVPVSDPVLYQNICACVRIRPDCNLDEAKLKEYCESIFLPNLVDVDTPRPKFFMITKEGFPKTATGKPSKLKLRQLAEEMFGSVKESGF